jgi:glycosyltransferase involved in cell wall biosynthesis
MKLSIIIATKNRAAAVAPCLDSVAAALARADHPEGEIVIVDNGSTDRTAAVIDGWASGSAVPVQAL